MIPAAIIPLKFHVPPEEQARLDALQRYAFLADTMPLIIWTARPDGGVDYYNKAWFDYTGLTLEQTRDWGWGAVVHPDDLARCVARWTHAFTTGEDYEIEYRFRRGSDRTYRWFLGRATARRDEAGGIVQWVGTGTDIDDQKRVHAVLEGRVAVRTAELALGTEALQQQETDLRLLGSAVEQAWESIMITEAQLDWPGPRIVFVNPAFTAMTGYAMEETVGRTPRILQGPRTDRAVLDRLRGNLERGEGFVGEAINYCKDGREFILEWQVAPLRDPGGRITHFVAIQRDITARRKAEATLAQTQQELVAASREAGMAEVATGVLHNVGNALNSVNVSATLVAKQVRDSKAGNIAKIAALFSQHQADLAGFLTGDERGRLIPAYLGTLVESLAAEQQTLLAELGHLRKNIEHIKDIVGMQQSYAKNSGLVELVPVTELVEDAIRINAGSLARHQVETVRDFRDQPVLSTERHKVMQILINLLRNAVYACDGSGRPDKRITVGIAARGEGVRITVADNGVGIPPENLARLFERGFTTRRDGHGFGLHSSILAARELGGSLEGRSAGSGLGATFILELPGERPLTRP